MHLPRDPEQNAQVRETRRKQILDAALTVYIRYGYHGTDMDAVAKEAQLAKGLVYYYYKTKKELFVALYTLMFDMGYSFSNALLENAEGLNPIERLMVYTYGIFGANREFPRMMQFNIRVPFDAYAVFGPEQWKDGALKSSMHREALAKIIAQGIAQGTIPATNPSVAANSFWTVFVANLFEYSKLILGEQPPYANDGEAFRETVRFCFQGLGIDTAVWNECFEKVIRDNLNGGSVYEGL